jgi:hypothetical protein
MKTLSLASFIFVTLTCQSQITYSGFIDKYPIQLVTHIYSDGDARAIYAYDKFDTPILIPGKQNGNRLELHEKDDNDKIEARLIFKNFSQRSDKILGEWINADSTKRLKITLTKKFDFENNDNTVWTNREMLQQESTPVHYFKLLISNEGNDARVTGVKILEKKTDRLIQTIELDCQLWGLENVQVGDYNFDGLSDFSVFEASYAGPNTSRVYILKVPDSEKYFVSEFTGTSLEFDYESKQIFEHNQCCAGRSIMNATYKVADNKMVLVNSECLEYDDEKEEHVKVECQ